MIDIYSLGINPLFGYVHHFSEIIVKLVASVSNIKNLHTIEVDNSDKKVYCDFSEFARLYLRNKVNFAKLNKLVVDTKTWKGKQLALISMFYDNNIIPLVVVPSNTIPILPKVFFGVN